MQLAEWLLEQRKSWRKDHPFGFIAKPVHHGAADTLLNRWECYIPGMVETDWKGGLYKVILTFPDNFPFVPPKLCFDPPFFHPNVSTSNGELIKCDRLCQSCAASRQGWIPGDWTPISEILLEAQRVLVDTCTELHVNPVARQVLTLYPEIYYAKLRQLAVQFSQQEVHRQLNGTNAP